MQCYGADVVLVGEAQQHLASHWDVVEKMLSTDGCTGNSGAWFGSGRVHLAILQGAGGGASIQPAGNVLREGERSVFWGGAARYESKWRRCKEGGKGRNAERLRGEMKQDVLPIKEGRLHS